MSEEFKRPAVPPPDKNDDMFESPEDLEKQNMLGKALQYWSTLADAYWIANHDALDQQKWHRRIVTAAVWTGTTAVILAVVQLLLRDQNFLHGILGSPQESALHAIAIVEFAAAVFAGLAVCWGLLSHKQEEWLLERHKAERMRMLKYRSLLKYAAKGMTAESFEELKRDSRVRLGYIENLNHDKLENWISVNQTWEEELAPSENCLTKPDMSDFLEYYRRKRLDAQTEYFNAKADRAEHKDWVTRLLPPLLFVLSIACAALHFGIDAFTKETTHAQETGQASAHETEKKPAEPAKPSQEPDALTLYLIVGAASLPILGAAIRTYRGAYEFSRNSKRFRATHSDLDRTGGSVKDPDKKPDAVLKELWKAEDSMEREHREWLRLMVEAEWFG